MVFHVKPRRQLFHVKQRNELHLLSYAEIAEDHIENILDIDPPGQAAESLGGRPELFGDEFLPP